MPEAQLAVHHEDRDEEEKAEQDQGRAEGPAAAGKDRGREEASYAPTAASHEDREPLEDEEEAAPAPPEAAASCIAATCILRRTTSRGYTASSAAAPAAAARCKSCSVCYYSSCPAPPTKYYHNEWSNCTRV